MLVGRSSGCYWLRGPSAVSASHVALSVLIAGVSTSRMIVPVFVLMQTQQLRRAQTAITKTVLKHAPYNF